MQRAASTKARLELAAWRMQLETSTAPRVSGGGPGGPPGAVAMAIDFENLKRVFK